MQVQKNLPRKKRRKLEAAREMLEDNEREEEEDEEGEEDGKRGRSRVSISVITHPSVYSRYIMKHCADYECWFCFQGKGKKNKEEPEKKGLTLVDLGYRRAKAVKAKQRAIDSGRMERPTSNKKQNKSKPRNQPRAEEMKDLFKSDMGEKKQGRGGAAKPRTKSKNSFKSKGR